VNNVDLVLDAKAELGEGPIWHSQKQLLYWVDIENHLVHIYDPKTNQDRPINVGQRVGTVVPRKSGGLMVAVHKGFASLDPESGELTILNDPEGLPQNRFNDGKCDPTGRFWAGTMALSFAKGAGSLYCLFPDLTAKKMAEDLTISNGLAWSLDNKTMYLIDSADSTVWAFDYDAKTAEIKNKRALIQFQKRDGSPDGMTLDSEGKLWIAHWDGARVTRWDPENGKLMFTQLIPASLVTSIAFGGPQLDQMYVTTARTGLGETTLATQHHAGGLFRFNPGVKGLPAPEFAG